METSMTIMTGKPERPFPKPMISVDGDIIVLFEKAGIGQVVWVKKAGQVPHQDVGAYSIDWDVSCFVDIPGKSLNINFNFEFER